MSDRWPISADIPPKSASHPSDGRLRNASAHRHHVFTLAQLEAEGLSARAVRDRAATGRLRRLYSGIYCIGPPTLLGRWMGAVLACGVGAVLSHASAAELRALIKARGGTIDVTVAHRSGRTREGLSVHSGHTLGPEDVSSHRGIPCTSVARTLLDCAATVTPRRLELAFGQADVCESSTFARSRPSWSATPADPGARLSAHCSPPTPSPRSLGAISRRCSSLRSTGRASRDRG